MKSIRLAFLALIMLAPLANAATTGSKIGVLDTVMVLSESNAGKQYAKKSESKFKPQLVALQKLESEVRNMQEKLQKDGPTLSAEQLKVRQLELQRKYEDWQLKGRQFQTERTEADNAEREKLRPKLQAAIDKVISELKLDLVIDRQMTIYGSPGIDITRKVIESLNQMK
ncbi:OmpH family outer membrane protein [Endozoicomonas sp. YOMI1]|uniref:OmpH family outer membrane protein n=1 Tax=Endozoicomonas sp. YOMI1 TaxID=2828739 RepID=UPI00214764A9|nr:OmpH family outer membrane protein [Endozoicomonas sp. YOMI1]